MQRRTEAASAADAVRGVKGLGVRELNFRICLLAVGIESISTGKHEQAIQDDREVIPSLSFHCMHPKVPTNSYTLPVPDSNPKPLWVLYSHG